MHQKQTHFLNYIKPHVWWWASEPCISTETPPMCKFPENWFHRVACTLISEICLKQLEHMLGNVCFEQTSLGFIIAFVFWLVFRPFCLPVGCFWGGESFVVVSLHITSKHVHVCFWFLWLCDYDYKYEKVSKATKKSMKACNLEWKKFDSLWFARLCLWE